MRAASRSIGIRAEMAIRRVSSMSTLNQKKWSDCVIYVEGSADVSVDLG